MKSGIKLKGHFDVICWDKDGNLKWEDFGDNLVVNVGLDLILDVLFVGSSSVVDPWYVGLADGTPTVASGDTMASHVGWDHVILYDEATRQEYVNVRASQNVTNSASTAQFTISSAATIGGAFLTSSITKDGSAGTLLCAVAFTGGDKTAADDDTIDVTYTFSAADA